MPRTPLFSHLWRTFAKALFARKHGLSDRAEIDAAWEAVKLDRRRVLQWSAGALAASALPVAAAGCEEDGPIVVQPGPSVAIIGAGMAGLHCAYRLYQSGVEVTVYEAADRVGGRTFTARDIFPEGIVAEFGGEFINSSHATIAALAAELGLTLDDRQADEPDGFKRDVYYMAGAEVPIETIVEQFIPVAAVMVDQVTKTDEDDAFYEELNNMTLQGWLDMYCPKTAYAELHDIIRVAYRGEYGCEPANQSALNLLYYIDHANPEEFAIFGASDERYHLHEGSDAIPTLFAEALGGRVRLQNKLIAARDGELGTIDLDIEAADKTLETITVDHLVLALPYKVLREADLTGLTLSDEKRTIIKELGYGTNVKVLGGYSSRLWREQYNAGGSLVTDLKIQQTWDASIGQEGTSGVLTNFLGGQGGVDSGKGTAEEYMQGVLPDVDKVWAGTQAAYVPDSAVRMHWPSYAFTKGSYTCYGPGQWNFYGLEGVREGNAHFAGEHTSIDFQGFMEGAAESGALAAMAILEDLGIAPTARHRAIVEDKLVVAQPWYGPPIEGLRTPERLRLRRQRRLGR